MARVWYLKQCIHCYLISISTYPFTNLHINGHVDSSNIDTTPCSGECDILKGRPYSNILGNSDIRFLLRIFLKLRCDDKSSFDR